MNFNDFGLSGLEVGEANGWDLKFRVSSPLVPPQHAHCVEGERCVSLQVRAPRSEGHQFRFPQRDVTVGPLNKNPLTSVAAGLMSVSLHFRKCASVCIKNISQVNKM